MPPKALPPQINDQLASFQLLGGLNGLDLWPWLNNIILLGGWLLIIIAPNWKYTKSLTLIPPVICAVVYSLGMINLQIWPESNPTYKDSNDPPPDITSLEGWVKIFEDSNMVFLGMVHFMVYDFMIARMIVLDSIENRSSTLINHMMFIIPCLLISMMFGPMGWLIYMTLRDFILPSTTKSSNGDGDNKKEK